MDLNLFIPITKIDIAKRLVTGTIAEEVPDRADEIMDYESAKPMFEAWSAEIAKASNGRSVGNLRAMHGSVAAGKLDQIHFDDAAKRIATVARVVDDSEWKKVLEGVYTGFSMGGRYVERWPDPADPSLTRYTPQPMEVSLVDHPCIPSATFEVVKADGTVELRKFRRTEAEKDVAREALVFADPGYQPDRRKRYPLDTQAHIRAAWAYIHHVKNQKPYSADQVAKIKAKIVAAWKAKIDPAGPPLAAGKAARGLPLAKDLGDVSQLALIIDDLATVADALGQSGADTATLKANLQALVALLHSLVEQATSGFAGDGTDNGDDDGDAGYDGAADDDADGGTDTPESDDADDFSYDEDGLAADDALAGKRIGPIAGRMLAKFAPRLDAFSKVLRDLTKRIEHLESQPLPGGPVTKFVTVTKAQDMAGRDAASFLDDPVASFQRHLEALPAGERAHLLTKLALKNPIVR